MKDKITGREIVKQVTITQDEESKDGAFTAITKAENQLRDEGFHVGSMCGDAPIGFAKGNYNYIAKWRNIPEDEYFKLSGIITVNDLKGTRHGYRDGHVTINYFKED